MELEKIILRNLLASEPFARKVLPFLKDEYFSGEDQIIFKQTKDFILKYNKPPTTEALIIEIDSLSGLSEDMVKASKSTLFNFKNHNEDVNIDWLTESAEKFCQEKAIYHALMKSIEVMNDKGNGSLTKGAIPKLLSDALAVSFDPNVGHDYLEQFDDRYEYYHRVQEKIPFDLDFFNRITNGGLPKKTLNIALAGCVHPNTKVKVRFRRKTN